MTEPSSNHDEETFQTITVQPPSGDDDGRDGDTAATGTSTGSDTPNSVPGRDIELHEG